MKPIQKAIKKAKMSIRKKEQIEHDQEQFKMCIDEKVCPKCADLLYVKFGHLKGDDYRYCGPKCIFTHYREPNIIAAEG